MSIPQGPSDQVPTTIDASQWQAFQSILQQKYETENLTLKAVREYMRETYSFSASPSQYQRAFNKWGFRKNTKRKDAEEIIVCTKKRKLSLSQVILAGASVQEQEKFQRALRRYNMPGLPYTYGLQNLKTPSSERNMHSAPLLSCRSEVIHFQKDRAITIAPKPYKMPDITSLPTFSLISQLGWRLPELSSLRSPNTLSSLITTKGASLKLSRLATRGETLRLKSIFFAHKILNRTLDRKTWSKLFSFIEKGSMDPMLRYMCCSKSYLAKAFIKNLVSACFRFEEDDQLGFTLQKLVGFGIDDDIVFRIPYSFKIRGHIKTTAVTWLQLTIASRMFSLATDLVQGGADVNMCGTHGRFVDHRQPRCCEMLPIALLLEQSVHNIADDIEAARLLSIMQENDLVCCQDLCLSSVATNHYLSWFVSKPGIDLNAPNLAQVCHTTYRKYLHWLSPLHSAIDQCKHDTVSMLLEAGASPFGYHFDATDAQSYRSSKDLFESYVTMPPLSVASFRGDLGIIRLLLSAGAPINGCQLDLHCQECRSSSDRQELACQPSTHHFCCAIQSQRSLEVRGLFFYHSSGASSFYDPKDAFIEVQPWKDLSKVGDKCQLIDYSVHFGHSALQLAVVTSQQDLVHELIRRGADIEGCHGLTPLALAICVGNATIIDMLLGYGADPRGFCKNGPIISPFSVAAYLDDVANMKRLMATARMTCYETSQLHECCPWEAAVRGKSYGAIAYLLNLDFSGSLVWDTGDAADLIGLAIDGSQWSLVQVFLDRWGRMLSNDQICSLLFKSVSNADFAATARLMALTGSPNHALMLEAILQLDLADARQRRSFIAFVLQAMPDVDTGAIVDMITEFGLFESHHEARKDVINYLNTHYSMTAADSSKLLVMLLHHVSDDDAALCLLENGMYVEHDSEPPEMTGLQYAARTHNPELVSRLIQLGADVNADAAPEPSELSGAMTALQNSISYGSIEIVKLLLDCGADINARADRSVLQIATWSADCGTDMIELLLERGADVNGVGDLQKFGTALQNAAQSNETDVAKKLLARGANVNAPALGSYGRTALQASVEQENHVLLKLFLEKGADVNALPAPERGVTALQAAAIVGDFEMCHTLVAAGAIIDADGSAKQGRTAIEGAAEHGRLDVLSWLLDILVDQYRGSNPERLKASIRSAKKFATDNEQDHIVQFLEEFKGTLDQKLM